MVDVVFSRCPVGSATEYIMRTGRLQQALQDAGARFCLLQEMDPKYQKAHFTQEEPLHFRDGGNIPPIWAQSQGDRSVLLGITEQHERQGLFVKPESDITCVEDLSGKRIALPIRTTIPVDFQRYTAYCALEDILGRHGMSMSDVTLVEIPCAAYQIKQSSGLNVMKRDFDFMTEEFTAVAEGAADVAYANSVKVVRHMQAGIFRNVLSPDQQIRKDALNNNNPILITCTKNFVRTHPELVELYLRELVLAAKDVEAHPQEFISQVCSGIYESTPEEMEAAYSDELTRIRTPRLDDSALELVSRRIEFLLRVGAIQQAPDLSAWADPSFLQRIGG